ncbi:MAG TPA: hypothetical protein VH144_01560 [Candidatus Saccharimonadales bacterium]|jgi:hypothetical protein|nr:hypothetical protein [Candidatus Saccharimonadales bacterium]
MGGYRSPEPDKFRKEEKEEEGWFSKKLKKRKQKSPQLLSDVWLFTGVVFPLGILVGLYGLIKLSVVDRKKYDTRGLLGSLIWLFGFPTLEFVLVVWLNLATFGHFP